MPRNRPQLSITLPRNFTFHYTEENLPRTPEREVPIPVPRSPRAEGAYRIKRRSRPPVNSIVHEGPLLRSKDIPLPTIESSTVQAPIRPSLQQRSTGPPQRHHGPPAMKFTTLPRTPTARKPIITDWESHKDLAESISRPLSACSLVSDSSNDSSFSLTSYAAGNGSCTSPESDAPDPFLSKFSSVKRGKSKQWAQLAKNAAMIQDGLATKQPVRVNWTSEMDRHLWTTYLTYLQDPTVTPFKTLPGVAPPLGVCHRVARQARRSWRAGRPATRTISDRASPLASRCEPRANTDAKGFNDRPGSPDTIKPTRSGSNTPTRSSTPKAPVWPKSGASTRRRLRWLCNRKPTIAPHYQRLMQSRSASPFSTSSRSASQSQSHSGLSIVTNSSPPTQTSASFNTRDIHVSLTTSTSATMQPNGPLSQLANSDRLPPSSQSQCPEWFNEPPVPFASEAAIPSDIVTSQEHDEVQMSEAEQIPRLASPFTYHTWGPSRTKQRSRPSATRMQTTESATIGPSLRSPVQLHETSPYQSVHKRRARYNLEEELSPGGSGMQQSLLDNLFGNGEPVIGRHRRVRSRGFSLGDATTPASNPLESLFTPPNQDGDAVMGDSAMPHTGALEQNRGPVTPPPQIPRLGSPFEAIPGISARPTRLRGASRHLATASLGNYDASNFSSIGETLSQADATTHPYQ